MTIYLIDGKPHRLCDCDEHSELCPRGAKRALQTCGFSRCFVPAPDAVYTSNDAAPADRIAELEAALAAERAAREAAEAHIDALMLEYCPDEMTPEQTERWAVHQKVIVESRTPCECNPNGTFKYTDERCSICYGEGFILTVDAARKGEEGK